METQPRKLATDPVCGMHVNIEHTKWVAPYEGHLHYFCSEACKTAFLASPERFAGHQGFFRRFLNRLTRANASRPRRCCGGN